MDGLDILLEEQRIAETCKTARINVRKDLFLVESQNVSIINKLGSGGSNAIVYKAIWQGKEVAFKVFRVDEFEGKDKFKVFEREVELLSSLRHPNILEFFGATIESSRVGFLMAFCSNGDLRFFLSSFLKKNGKQYPIIKKLKMLNEIASACLFVHSKGVIHRDLKPENVLVDCNETVKLMDFGLSVLDFGGNGDKTKTMRVGTSVYMAPEVISGHYNEKADCYSFGILCFVVLSQAWDPFESIGSFGIENRVLSDDNFRPNIQKLVNITQVIREMITMLWNADPAYRPSMNEVSKVFSSEIDLISLSNNTGSSFDECGSLTLEQKYSRLLEENRILREKLDFLQKK